jgi:protein O-mannosyl-transferase
MAFSEAHGTDVASSERQDLSGSRAAFSPGRPYLFLALSLVITAALYLPHLTNVFIDWDLVAYRNILYTTDYWNTTVRLFTDFQGKVVTGYYAPFASVSLMLDKWLIGGTEPSAWFTLCVNLALHCLNGLLVFQLLRAVGASPQAAVLGGLIFLIHPLQTSSILWFSQRKGLLATTLYLLAYLSFLRYADRRTVAAYCGSLALFAIGLFTKPTVVVLPVALLAWKVMSERTERSARPTEGTVRGGLASSGDLLAEARDGTAIQRLPHLTRSAVRHVFPLLPFFLVAVASGLAAVQSEGVSMNIEAPPDLPIEDRPFIAAAAIWFYMGKALLPLDLTPIYPQWDVNIHHAVWWVPLLGLAGAFALLLRYRDRIGNVSFWCLFNFLIPLLPVIGVMKFGYLRLAYVADHFMYLPMVGMAGLIGVLIYAAVERARPLARPALIALAVAYVAFLGAHTWWYGASWKDSITFWSYNLAHNPLSWSSHTYLGHALIAGGRARDSIPFFEQTIALKSAYIDDHLARARRLERAGRQSEAKRELTRAENVKKTLAIAYHNLGNAFLISDLHIQALEQYKKAIQLQPRLVGALTNLGVCYIASGDFPEAVRHLAKAVELSPNNYEAHYNLGYALRVLGDRARAEKHFAKALALRPDARVPEFPEDRKAGTQGREYP